MCAGSDLNVLGNYFKYFCLYVAFLTCVVIAFKVPQNTIEYWASFSITVFSLKKKKNLLDIHLSPPSTYPAKRESICFKSVSSHISVVLCFFYTSFDS